MDVYEANPVVEAQRAVLFAYEETPCSNCRHRAVALLQAIQCLPAGIREECRFDANDAIREAVA